MTDQNKLNSVHVLSLSSINTMGLLSADRAGKIDANRSIRRTAKERPTELLGEVLNVQFLIWITGDSPNV